MPDGPMDVLALLKAKQAAQPTEVKATSVAPVPVSSAAKTDPIVETLEVTITAPTPKKHTVDIIHKSDPAQVYPYLANCSCGFQARTYSAEMAHSAAEEHLGRAKQPVIR